MGQTQNKGDHLQICFLLHESGAVFTYSDLQGQIHIAYIFYFQGSHEYTCQKLYRQTDSKMSKHANNCIPVCFKILTSMTQVYSFWPLVTSEVKITEPILLLGVTWVLKNVIVWFSMFWSKASNVITYFTRY